MKASRASFEQLLAAYEEQFQSQSAEIARRRRLYENGEVSKSFLMSAERDLASTRAHMMEVQQWIFEDDLALDEALAREDILRGPALGPNGYAESQTLIRFNGAAKWSLADSAKIEKFFLGRFGRALMAFLSSREYRLWRFAARWPDRLPARTSTSASRRFGSPRHESRVVNVVRNTNEILRGALSGKERYFAEFILSAVEGLSMTQSEGLRMTLRECHPERSEGSLRSHQSTVSVFGKTGKPTRPMKGSFSAGRFTSIPKLNPATLNSNPSSKPTNTPSKP